MYNWHMQAEPAQPLTPEALRGALEISRERRRKAQDEIAALERVVAESTAEERLIGELLSLRGLKLGTDSDPGRAAAPSEVTRRGGNDAGHHVVSEVLSILQRENRPVHVSELMRLLRQRQIQIPGAGSQANLISHIGREPKITRPARGMYALAIWGIEPERPRATKRRRKVKMVASLEDVARSTEEDESGN